MACLKFSELSKELNKHFSNYKDEQKKKDKAIRNLGNDFRSAFESADGKACEKSYDLNNNENDFVNTSNLSDLANDLFNDDFINTVKKNLCPLQLSMQRFLRYNHHQILRSTISKTVCSKEQTNSENISENEVTVEEKTRKRKRKRKSFTDSHSLQPPCGCKRKCIDKVSH